MDAGENENTGLFSSVKRLGSTVLAILHNRLELLAVELQEERARLVNTVLLTALIVLLAGFTLITAATALVIVVWVKFGVNGIFAASGAGLVATLLTYWWLHTRLKNWRPLPGTLAELKKDREWLAGKK